MMLTDEYRYKLLSKINDNPHLSQRELASELGISLGKVNFCLKALVEVGLVKVDNFRNSKNKSGYLYLLTPKGIEQKSSVTKRFLQEKIKEHDTLMKEIDAIQQSLQK
ncbi:MarR family EPS-associated transcriptional regulator [Eionea flava]